jgi:hypothetical protein
VTIGIIFMPTGRPVKSTPAMFAIMNITDHATTMATKNAIHRADLMLKMVLTYRPPKRLITCQTNVRHLNV